MGYLLDRLANVAHLRADDVAVVDAHGTTTYRDLMSRTWRLAKLLSTQECRHVALAADNSADWIVSDLAAWLAGSTVVPVPPYFTPAQVEHLLDSATIDTVIVQDDNDFSWFTGESFERICCDAVRLSIFKRFDPLLDRAAQDARCRKITFTSGSTRTPRGVMLSGATLDLAVQRLASLFSDFHVARHLCTVPLATLLENVAGVYLPLTRGATVVAPPLGRIGLYGSSRIDAERFTRTVNNARAESLILQPQVLRALTAEISSGSGQRPVSLKFVAVGGAKVDEADLREAHAVGIPAYQGYGLSECASVIALNRPGASRANSVGRPLPGIDVRIAEDGEIIVNGQCMNGYLDGVSRRNQPIRTGDLGRLDDDGYLYVTGRKKNMFITSFGRNVSPEWPESVLLHEPEIAQVCVFGEAMPYNTAVVVPAGAVGRKAIANAIARANLQLPDYAQVTNWVTASEPFCVPNGELTSTGKLRRDAIARRYVVDAEAFCNDRPAVDSWTPSIAHT